jgi:hypothetical protein
MAVDLYKTGNVNLRSPYCFDKKEEAMYPIHLATVGGNLKLVRWLISEKFCPLHTVNQKKKGKNQVVLSPVVTSKGKSVLEIALYHQRIDIVHYLVSEKKLSLFDEKTLSTEVALANLTSVLNMLPPNYFDGIQIQTTAVSIPESPTFPARSSIQRSPSF